MTPRSLILCGIKCLRQAGVPDPETDASLLLSHLTGRAPLSLRADMDTDLPPALEEKYRKLLCRREQREPLQYILGSASFCGVDFLTDTRALIPRNETALLVHWALDVLASHAFSSPPRVLDLCCGSGCIGLSLKHHLPGIDLTLSDLSEDALSLTRDNACRLGVDVHILQGDLFSPLSSLRFDLILSNPPYIPTDECPGLQKEVLFEPLSALDGGGDGLDFYRRISREASAHLLPCGCLMLEAGYREAPAIRSMLLAGGAVSVEIRQDLEGVDRMLLAQY